MPDKIVVVGPGALGCLLAVSLARTGAEVFLLDHDPERAALLDARGIILEQGGESHRFSIPVLSDPRRIGPASLILLCVKSPAVTQSLPSLPPLLGPDSLLVAWQNGIAHLPLLGNAALPCPAALAVTSLGANLAGPGHVRFAGAGATSLGFAGPAGEKAAAALLRTAGLFAGAGLETRIVADILAAVWDKLLVNVGINALTAIYDCANGELLRRPEALTLMREAVAEAATVALALGIAISPDPLARTIEVCQATAGNISSMLQDVRRRRPTEIEAINGAVLAEAERLGLPAPVNARLLAEVKALYKTATCGPR